MTMKFLLSVLFIIWCSSLAAHQHVMDSPDQAKLKTCQAQDVTCAKTVTIATHPNGDIWRVWANNNQMYYAISHDLGKHFGKAIKIKAINEKISARGENRPKIAFSNTGHVYLSWSKPGSKKYTGDIRFSYSQNGGQSFAKPITVNNDNLITGHSFNEMIVTQDQKLVLIWLDGRDKYKAKKAGHQFNGSSIYLAQANFENDLRVTFSNIKLAQGTCVCCRLTLVETDKNQVSIMYRDIFGDNIRDFSLINYDLNSNEVISRHRVTQDEWFINGCPHQGAGISKTASRLHLTWFNQGSKGKGIFYGYTDTLGKKISKPIPVGELSKQAVHPNIISNDKQIDIVWLEFNGVKNELWHKQSLDNGHSFQDPTLLTTSSTGADRPFLFKSKNGSNHVSWHKPKTAHWTTKL